MFWLNNRDLLPIKNPRKKKKESDGDDLGYKSDEIYRKTIA
jgi:hypothetical protein